MGLDYDRLKLATVASFCLWLLLYHGVVRRRLGWGLATALAAVFATAPLYLAHTDELLSEFAHMSSVAVVVLWYDRMVRNGPLIAGRTRDLVVLGVLVAASFNFRRESIVLMAAVVGVMLFEVWRDSASGRSDRLRRYRAGLRRHAGTLAIPVGVAAASITVFQFVLPTHLLPQFGADVRSGIGEKPDPNGRFPYDDRVGEFPGILTDQLGLGVHPAVGVVLLVLAGVGIVVGVRLRPRHDLFLALIVLSTVFAVAGHPRRIERYWLQITPWVAYFAVVAVVAAVHVLVRRRRRAVVAIAAAPLAVLTGAHLVALGGEIDDAREFNSAGRVEFGPARPGFEQMFDAVVELTPPDAVIAYYRARTMTLLTDRRSFQTESLEQVVGNADYFVQVGDWTFWQPELDDAEADRLGFREVWRRGRLTVWEVSRGP